MKATVIYGPPGCGKTTRMLALLEQAVGRHHRNKIGFLSFTKAGAAEALKRLDLTRSEKIRTIHSLMYALNEVSAASVVDHHKLRVFEQKTGYRFRGQSNDLGEQMEVGDQYKAVLDKATNQMLPLKDAYYESARPGDWAGFKHFAESYTTWKKANGYLDFNDMLGHYLLTPVDPGMTALFVDEAQDLSNLQWAVIDEMLKFGRIEEVWVAGDDDQAIYEWSGANTHGMDRFANEYGAEVETLQQSWRVPVSVHGVATGVLGHITTRVEKEYYPRPHPGKVIRSSGFNPKNVKHGEDVMILCRSHMTKTAIEQELIRHRIPYKNEGGMPGLFNSRVAEAIRAFKRFEAGGTVSMADLERMTAVGDDKTKATIQSRDFKALLARGWLRSFRIPPNLIDFYRSADLTQEPTIRLSTIHAAKGREADKVILHAGITERIIREMTESDQAVDAESRVWYVGVTRARDTLEIIEDGPSYDL